MEAEGQSERQVSLNSNTRRETRRSGTLEERYNDRGSLELRLLTDRWENEGKRTAPVHFVEWLDSQQLHISFYSNDEGQTALHLAVLHRMPEELISVIVQRMEKCQVDRRDVNGRRAIDYLLDWPSVSVEVLQEFIRGNADITEGHTSPLIRLCRRPTDGHELLKSIFAHNLLHLTGDIKNRMLEEAVKRGSGRSVKLLLNDGVDPKACGSKYLLFEAAEANHDSMEKVGLLLDYQLDSSQQNEAGQTLVHIAAGGKPPRLDFLDLSLKKGIDPNLRDSKGDTALHKVTKNYAERTVPWMASEQAMERLLREDGINLNVKNAKGLTPLHNLIAAKDLSFRLLWMWHEGGAAFVEPKAQDDALLKSPLADLCRRRDGPQFFGYLSRQLDDEMKERCFKYLLQAAVLDGTAEMVKVLLDHQAKANEWEGLLLMMAACTKIDAEMKIRYLHDRGAKYTYRDPRGYSVLHAAAQSATADKGVVRICMDASYLNLTLERRDRYMNTPLHIAAMSKKDCSDVLVGSLADKEQGGDPNSLNRDKKTPFRLVLKHNYDRKELRRNKLMFLLERGCLPTKGDFEEYKGNADDFQNLFLSSELVAKSHNPIQLLLVLGWYCQHPLPDVGLSQPAQSSGRVQESSDWARTVKWRNLNAKFEEEAVMIISEFGKKEDVLRGVMTNSDVQEAANMGWEMFLANKYVGKMLNQMFYGRVDASSAEEKLDEMQPGKWKTSYRLPILTLVFLLQSLILPFYLLINKISPRCLKQYVEGNMRFRKMLSTDPKKRPIVTVVSYLVSYLVFLVFVIAHIVKEGAEKNVTWNERIILLYVTAMLLEEINQVISFGRNYVTVTNVVDDFMILCYCTFLVMRGVGTANGDLILLRIAEHVFAVAAALSFLRLLYYLQVSRRLGPVLISITEVTTEVLSFLIILGIVWVAFSVAISGVFGAGVYTAEFQNGSISLPSSVQGLWPSLKTMYWSLFGQVDNNDLDSPYDVLSPESTIGLIVFGFWLLASVIVLLNMLIALINEAFERVKKQNADLVWNLAVSRIITEVNTSPSLPLPINIFYLFRAFVLYLCNRHGYSCGYTQEDGKGETRDRSLLEMPNAKRILEGYQATKRCREKSKRGGLAQEHVQEMKDLQSQTYKTLLKEIKRLESHMRLSREDQGEGDPDGQPSTDRNYGNNSDSDCEEDQQPALRRNHVSCTEHEQLATVLYKGKDNAVGGCQFLRTRLSHTRSYFEVVVADYGKDGRIGVGLAHRNYPLNRMPGCREDSIAYHCDNGKLFYKNEEGLEMATPAQQGDVIGCGVKVYSSSKKLEAEPIVFFTRNGEEIASQRVLLPKDGLFPIVGFCSEGSKVTVHLNVEWKSPDDEVDEEPSDVLLSRNMLRIRDDCLRYNNRNRQLLYTAGLPQIEEHIGVFQDLSHPISREFSYFEVQLLDMGVKGEIGIGVAHRQYPLHRMPGWSKASTAYHCDDGSVFKGLSRKSIFSRAERGDVIGCGVKVSSTNSKQGKVFFTRNQVLFEDFEIIIPTGGFYPIIGMSSAGEEVRINFDAKWPPQTSRTFPERVHTDGNVIEYIGDRFRRVGAYQSTDRPMSREFSYYEVTIQDYGKEGRIGVGLARNGYPLNKQPGWLPGSVAWHCNDGDVFIDERKYAISLSPAKEGDVVGCGVDFTESQNRMNIKQQSGVNGNITNELVVFFTLNGQRFDQAVIVAEPDGGLFPIVGLQTPGETVEINLSPPAVSQGLPGAISMDTHSARCERVRVDSEKDCVSYVANPCDFVGGLQFPKNMEEVSYFEVSIVSAGDKRQIGIGVATQNFLLDHQPGWLEGSVGYHCDDGFRYYDGKWENRDRCLPSTSDIIGCGIRPSSHRKGQAVFFTHNGREIGEPIQFKDYSASELYPTICLHSRGEAVKIHMGAEWQGRSESVFSRSQHVKINGNKAVYDSFEHMKVGAVQLTRRLSRKHPYFEVRAERLVEGGTIGVGLAPSAYPLGSQPGWRPGSVGYHCQDGCLFEGRDIGRPIHHPGKQGASIGCGVDYVNSTEKEAVVFFTYNSKRLKQVSKLEWPENGLFPTIGMNINGESIEVITNAKFDNSLVTKGETDDVRPTGIPPLYRVTSC